MKMQEDMSQVLTTDIGDCRTYLVGEALKHAIQFVPDPIDLFEDSLHVGAVYLQLCRHLLHQLLRSLLQRRGVFGAVSQTCLQVLELL